MNGPSGYSGGAASALLLEDQKPAGLGFVPTGICLNSLVIGVYLVSRTTCIPWLGPEAGQVEEVGVADAVSKLFELTLVFMLIRLALQSRHLGVIRQGLIHE